MSDFTVMSSWFEPCGLVHKEIAAFSGSIPIVNKVGGLTDGLTDGVNAILQILNLNLKTTMMQLTLIEKPSLML